jgi:hypothetical protein
LALHPFAILRLKQRCWGTKPEKLQEWLPVSQRCETEIALISSAIAALQHRARTRRAGEGFNHVPPRKLKADLGEFT